MNSIENFWARIKALRVKSSDYTWSLADQAFVSAANFLALLLIARFTSASEVGIYVIGLSVLTLCLAVQDSLIIRPYSVQMLKPAGTFQEHAFSALAQSFLLSAIFSMICLAGAAINMAVAGQPVLTIFLAVLSFAIPFGLLREFMRRFGFANLQMFRSFSMDLASAALGLCALAFLALSGNLSATTALAGIAVAQGSTAACWLVAYRSSFRCRFGVIGENARMGWKLGRWLLPGKLAMESQGYMPQWVSMLVGGTAMTGVYSASLSIVGLANPFLHGMFNVILPKSVRVLHDHGYAGLWKLMLRQTAIVAVITGLFVLLIHFAGETLMGLLFASEEFSGHGDIVTILALSYFAAAVGGPPTIALISAERGREVAAVGFATCIGSFVLVYTSMSVWGLMGAACGVLANEIIGSTIRWFMLMHFLRDGKTSATAMLPTVLDNQPAGSGVR